MKNNNDDLPFFYGDIYISAANRRQAETRARMINRDLFVFGRSSDPVAEDFIEKDESGLFKLPYGAEDYPESVKAAFDYLNKYQWFNRHRTLIKSIEPEIESNGEDIGIPALKDGVWLYQEPKTTAP